MKWALSEECQVFTAQDRKTAIEALATEKPCAITLDLGLPPCPQGVEEGFQTLAEILSRDPYAKIVVVTGREDRECAIKAIGQGAWDFFCKPIQIDELKVVVRRAIQVWRLEQEHRDLQKHLRSSGFEDILGQSPQIQEVFAAIRKVANTHVPVLICGESGTGKELVAKAIHRYSARKEGPFIPINCGAIPEALLESELFGHEKGAFTGAHLQRKGRVELAHDGTLFLDEVGELSLVLQVKLLRFLQDGRIERIGGREQIAVHARVIAATNKDLKLALRDGHFREDLYYRLGVVTISLPPLTQREGDVLMLAKDFLERHALESGKQLLGFTPSALRRLEAHRWPGNVRELDNRIKRAVLMAEGKTVTPEDLELASPYSDSNGRGLKGAREALERDLIQRVLAKHRGNLSQSAAELGVSRPTLYDLIKKLAVARQ
jgi:two-component system NtrC family response regulator